VIVQTAQTKIFFLIANRHQMKKYFLSLVVAFGLTIAHAQVVPKNKPVSNAEPKSSAENIDTTRAVVKRIVKFNDSVFVYDGESLLRRVPAKDWLDDGAPAINARSKANTEADNIDNQTGFTMAVKKNDSIYVYSNGKLLMKRADRSKTVNGNTQATVVDGVPMPVLLQQK
jgi:hypothetical protein